MIKKIHSLDLLRGILSLLVVFPHAWQVFITPFEGTSAALGAVARTAVLLFFCLSGYVISMSIDNNRKRGSFSLLDFAAARISRIVPPLMGSMFLIFILAYFLNLFSASSTTIPGAARHGFYSSVGTQGAALFTLGTTGNLAGQVNGPLWTLGYELRLYAIAGLLAVVIFSKKHSYKGLSLFVLCNLIPVGRQVSPDVALFTTIEKLFFVAFGFGAAMYWLELRTRFLVACLLISWVALWVTLPLALAHPISELDDSQSWVLFQCNMVATGTFLVALISKSDLQTRFTIGDWSYSLYILHFPILLFLWMISINHFPKFTENFKHPLMAVCFIFTIWCSALMGTQLERFRIHISHMSMKQN